MKITYATRSDNSFPFISLIEHTISNRNIVELNIETEHKPSSHMAGINDDRLALAFEELFTLNSTLKILNLKGNSFKNVVGYGIVEGLKINESLHTLNLDQNMFSEEIYVEIANIVSNNETLYVVKLEAILLDKSDINTTQHPYDPSITLNMVENAFANALMNNTNLIELEIKNNYFSTGVIFDAMKYNNALRILNLGHNRYGPHVVDKIIDMIKVNTALEVLDLTYGPGQDIALDDLNRILTAVQYNPSLITIHIKYGYITSSNEYLLRNMERKRATNENLLSKLLTTL